MGNKSSAPPPAPPADDGEAPQFVIHERVRVRSARRPRTRCVLVVALCCSTVINTVEPEPDTSQAGHSVRILPLVLGLNQIKSTIIFSNVLLITITCPGQVSPDTGAAVPHHGAAPSVTVNQLVVQPPRKPLNSRPRVRRCGPGGTV